MKKEQKEQKERKLVDGVEGPPRGGEQFLPTEEIGEGLLAGVVNVTPTLAKKWLSRNHPDNRGVVWSKVESFASDIRSGNWILTHQAICFDGTGWLIDGQHRLHAVVLAERAVKILVVGNPGSDMGDPIDRTTPRSLAYLTGLPNRTVAAINTLRMFEQGASQSTPMTTAESLVVYEHHKEWLERLRSGVTNLHKVHGPMIASCAWCMPVNPALVLTFTQQLATGEMIKRGDPAFALRAWIEQNPGLGSWTRAMAAMNACRFAVTEKRLKAVYTGESGYRAVTGRRRALKIPHTPSVEIVTSASWTPSNAEPVEQG